MSKSDVMASPAKEKPKHEDEYHVKSAMDDLMRAEEHKADPKMMAAISKHAHKKAKAINSIAGLRKHAHDVSKKKGKLDADGDYEKDGE